MGGDAAAREAAYAAINSLQVDLARALNRPALNAEELAHEVRFLAYMGLQIAHDSIVSFMLGSSEVQSMHMKDKKIHCLRMEFSHFVVVNLHCFLFLL